MSEIHERGSSPLRNTVNPSTASLPTRSQRPHSGYSSITTGLGIGRRPNYGTELTIRLKDSHPAELYGVLCKWVEKKLGSSASIDLGDFISGQKFTASYLNTSLETRSFQKDTELDTPSHWALRLSQQDSRFPARTWETNIGITRISDTNYKIKVLNEYVISPDFHGEVRPPQLSTPAFMRDILRDEKWDVYSGSSPVTALPQRVHASNADEFLQAVCDPDRKLLVFAVAKVHQGGGESYYPVNMVKLARSLEGVGVVYGLEDAREIQETMGYLAFHSLKPVDIPYQGFGQVYYPVRSSQGDMRKLRLPVDVIEAQSHRESDVHISALRCSINGVGYSSSSSSAIGNLEDIHALEQAKDSKLRIERIEQYTKRLSEVEASKRDSAAYEPLIDELKKELVESQTLVSKQSEELRKLESENEKLQEDNEVFETLVEQEKAELKQKLKRDQENQVIGLVQRNEQLEKELLSAKKGKEVLASLLEPLKENMNPSQMLDYLEVRYPENLVILEDAHESAMQMVEEGDLAKPSHRKKANELLELVATTLYEMKFVTEDFEPRRFKAQTGFEVNMTESAGTKNRPDLMRHRYVEYKGETRCAEAHLKYGNTPKEQIRIHFFFDESEEKVVIAKVADHLPVYSSTKAGKRR